MNGRDVVSASLRLIGAIAPSESIQAQEAVDGLSALNRMLDSWSTEGLSVFATTQEAPITLTAGSSTYTLGTAGNLTTRPMEIVSAFIRDGATDYPIKIISAAEFSALSNKAIQTTYPRMLFDDGGYPLRTLTLYPTPSASKTLVLMTRRPLIDIATLDTPISLPPGYERAIIYNLALDLAPEYGRPTSDAVVMVASDSKAGIKRANHRVDYLRTDSALMPRKRFNIYTGEA